MDRLGLSISCVVVVAVVACCTSALVAADAAPAQPAPAQPATPPPAAPTAAQLEFFESKIRPVLVDQCFKCHSANAAVLKGDLRLDSREGVFKGGESEAPSVVAGDPDSSPLITAVRYEEEALRMPPKSKLSDAQIADLEAWVKMGAPYPDSASSKVKHGPLTIAEGRQFWSFVPPKDPIVPQSPTEWARNDVDRFIAAKLAEKQIAPSPRADKRTLIRRATYDLIGLPPTAAEFEAFERDESANAFEQVIDRLLASPHYGERWGRYWLDVARYADTKGYVFEEERRYPFSYTYRDWVVRAFNEDLPYDQFLVQQIAADKLELGDDKRPLAALGFLTLGRRFLNNRHDIIDDRIDVVTRGTMALTVACARCHDHKYDPIPTADYYSLYGVFASSTEPADQPTISDEKTPESAAFESELAKRKAALEAFVNSKLAEGLAFIRRPDQVSRYLLAAQKEISPPELAFETLAGASSLYPDITRRWKKFLKDRADQNDTLFAAWRRYVAIPHAKFAEQSAEVTRQIRAAATENALVVRFVATAAPPKTIDEVAERYGKLLAAYSGDTAAADPAIEAVRSVTRGDGSPTTIGIENLHQILTVADAGQRRGLQQQIDALIATHPGAPQKAMAMADLPTAVEPTIFKRGNPGMPGAQVPRQFLAVLSPDDRKPFSDGGSGRLALAKSIANKDNPLTARVMVNRVWQYHFGQGLVRTPSDFGTRGEHPTHPELLDYLAIRFANEDGWSIKKLHKRIMLSQTYQQSSTNAPSSEMIVKDPENRLLWRMNPRRLDIESMRDSLLATSGALDPKMGGRPVDIFAEPFVPRRTIYAFIDRQNLPGMFRTFDFASPDSTSGQRFATSVPQQALFMMNSPFVIEQSKKLAARPEITSQADAKQRVTALYRIVFGRTPSNEELELGTKFVAAEEGQPKPELADKKSPWQYGFGQFDEASQRLASFYPLPHFTGERWQGGPKLPDPKLGWVLLTRTGGHAGNDHAHAAVRRWVAPRDVTISVAGSVSHQSPHGDGVRARLISSREGLLAAWNVQNKSADTKLGAIALKQGETLDFAVDNGRANDHNSDSFTWQVTITKEAAAEPIAGDDTGGTWVSASDFAGPSNTPPPNPMTAWEKYAQVLLESNEFVFVD